MPIPPKERPRRPVHVCTLCSAIWEGAASPPAICPQCGSSNGWTSGEVGDQPGMVGGRVFIQGTDKPMTRVFVCGTCHKTTVVRGKQDDPTACACGSALLVQAMTGKKPEVPVAPAAQAAIMNARAPDMRYCFHPKGGGICGNPEPCAEHDVRVPEKSDGETSPTLSAEEYRAEWVSERVANWFERHDAVPTTDIPSLWALTAQLYDEGKRQGFLP